MAEKLTAIVILHFGEKIFTWKCIESILRNEDQRDSLVIFVTDNSDEQDFTLGENLCQRNIIILRTGKNLGFAGGMNFGIREALKKNADFVFLLNNDVILEKNCLAELMNFLSDKKSAGMVSPLIVYESNPDKIWATGSKIHPFLGRSRDPFHDKKTRKFPSPIKVDALTGCALMIKAEVFGHIGFFDENYFAYYEDVDLCRRAGSYGYELYFYPHVKIRHAVSASTRNNESVRSLPEYFMIRNRIYFMKKYSGRTAWVLFCLVVGLETVCNLMKNAVRLRFGKLAGFLAGIHDACKREPSLARVPAQYGISACIITKDAGETIERCLASLQQAVDEIVIVDSGSRDDTLAICRRYTERIYRTEFNGDFSELRNKAARHAGNPWILAMDADEYLSEELRLKIRQLCATDAYWGYYIKRINFYGDTIIKFGFPGIDSLVRLYRKNGSFFAGKVHEKVISQGLSKRVPLAVFHRPKFNNFTCRSFRNKWLAYIAIDAREKSKVSKVKKVFYLLSAPLVFFFILFRDLFVLLGILDGGKGIKIALLLAFYRYKLFVSIYKTNA